MKSILGNFSVARIKGRNASFILSYNSSGHIPLWQGRKKGCGRLYDHTMVITYPSIRPSIYVDNIAKESQCPAEERDRNMAISG